MPDKACTTFKLYQIEGWWKEIPDFPNMFEPKFIGMHANESPYRQHLRAVEHPFVCIEVYKQRTIIQKTLKDSIYLRCPAQT
jgi:hypothetical protein